MFIIILNLSLLNPYTPLQASIFSVPVFCRPSLSPFSSNNPFHFFSHPRNFLTLSLFFSHTHTLSLSLTLSLFLSLSLTHTLSLSQSKNSCRVLNNGRSQFNNVFVENYFLFSRPYRFWFFVATSKAITIPTRCWKFRKRHLTKI